MRFNVIGKGSFDIIKSAVNKTVDLIKPTFGPASNKVIISKITHGFVVDDGVQIARDLEFDDPVENAIMKVVRETAIKTNDRVGDGTTGALIMLQAIINEVSGLSKIDGRKIEKELKAGFDECKSQLLKMSKPVKTIDDLTKVAMVSFDDEKIAKLIAKAWYELGIDGVLTVDKSGTMETTVDMTDGVKLARGYISPYMINNPQRMECVIEKPYILFTDYRLTEAADVIGIMDQLLKRKILSLVIIADGVEGNALATLIVNKMQGKFDTVAVTKPPADSEMLEDLAFMTGGKVFSDKKGDKLENATVENLGRATRFIARRDESFIVGPRGNKEAIKGAIKDLTTAMEAEKDESSKKKIQRRLGRFTNKVGVVKVGAPTENEVNALKYKIEDSVNATLSAYKSGVVCGGGMALAGLMTSSEILNAALKEPFKQLKINVGLDSHRPLLKDEAVNVVTGEIGNYVKVGVMDPVEVLIAQIESAVSIASLLVTTSGMIIERPRHIKQEEEE
jgi:chaperonin GroEL